MEEVLESERARDSYLKLASHERCEPTRRQYYRNRYYVRDMVTRFGTIRLRIARTRSQKFLPGALGQFQRRAEDVAILIREAFLRGISTRQVGRLVAIFTGEPVSLLSAFGARNFMKTGLAYYRVVVRRGRVGNGVIETVGKSDPERARLSA